MSFNQKTIKISTVQLNTVLGDIDRNLEKHYQYIEQAIDEKSDVIVFPELSLTGYSLKDAVSDVALPSNDKKYDELKKLSRHISIIVGAVELDTSFKIFNSGYFFENGGLLAKHRKVYLPAYGLFEEDRYFSAGQRFRAFDSKLGRFGLLICEDMWHPTSGIILAQDGATLLFVTAAGVARGVGTDSKPENVATWEALNKSLAIYSTSYIIFSNRVGLEDGLSFWGGSEIVDPSGHRNEKAPYFDEHIFHADINMLKLKHARINTTLLGDERLDIVIEEFSRLKKMQKEY